MENAQKIQERLDRILGYSVDLQDRRTFEQQQNRNVYLQVIEHNAKQTKGLIEEDAIIIKAKITNVLRQQDLLKKAMNKGTPESQSGDVICKDDRNQLLTYMVEILTTAGYAKRILLNQLKEEVGSDELPTEEEGFHDARESMQQTEIDGQASEN